MLRKLQLSLFTLLLASASVFAAFAAPPVDQILVDPALAAMFAEDGETITTEDFLALTPKKIRQATGERLGLQKSIALKAAQKALRKDIKKAKKGQAPAGGDRNQLVALLLAIFLGGIGVHSFYLGQTGKGIAQIVLFLTSFLIIPGIALLIWVIIDIIRIATGSLTPKNGVYDPEL
ncbi:MAG: TM2 domain-containing protein [Bacteroidota bacterium]